MTKLILIHNINKFYKIFWEALDYDFQVHISNFDDNFLLQVLYDIDEVLKAQSDCFYEECYALDIWLNKLKLQILNYREKTPHKIAIRIWTVLTVAVLIWFAYSYAEWLLKDMSAINFFTVISNIRG